MHVNVNVKDKCSWTAKLMATRDGTLSKLNKNKQNNLSRPHAHTRTEKCATPEHWPLVQPLYWPSGANISCSNWFSCFLQEWDLLVKGFINHFHLFFFHPAWVNSSINSSERSDMSADTKIAELLTELHHLIKRTQVIAISTGSVFSHQLFIFRECEFSFIVTCCAKVFLCLSELHPPEQVKICGVFSGGAIPQRT